MEGGVSESFPELDAVEAARWRFLEEEREPAIVLTRQMQAVYLNAAARSLAPLRWFGRRCWEILSVGERGCDSRCEAVQAVSRGKEIACCEETVYSREGLPLLFGLAVIPLPKADGPPDRSIVLFRRKDGRLPDDVFRKRLLQRAEELRSAAPPLAEKCR